VNTLSTASNGYGISLLGGGTIDTATTFLNTGTTTIGDDVSDSMTFSGGLAATAGAVSAEGTVATTNAALTLGALTLTDALTLRSGSGAVTVASATDGSGAHVLTLGNGLQTGSFSFSGSVSLGGLATAGGAYGVALLGSTSVDADTNFLNTGTVTLGDGGDTLTFAGGLATTGNLTNPGTVSIGGTLQTTGARMDLGAATLTAASRLDTGTGAPIAVGAITSGGNALMIDAGTAAGATIDLTSFANGTGGLTIIDAGGLVTFGDVGSAGPGAVTVTDADDHGHDRDRDLCGWTGRGHHGRSRHGGAGLRGGDPLLDLRRGGRHDVPEHGGDGAGQRDG
jgi:hypothetical protein